MLADVPVVKVNTIGHTDSGIEVHVFESLDGTLLNLVDVCEPLRRSSMFRSQSTGQLRRHSDPPHDDRLLCLPIVRVPMLDRLLGDENACLLQNLDNFP